MLKAITVHSAMHMGLGKRMKWATAHAQGVRMEVLTQSSAHPGRKMLLDTVKQTVCAHASGDESSE